MQAIKSGRESELIVTLIERQERNRRSDYSPEFPLTDSEGASVLQDRRRLPDRRGEKYDLDDLDDKVYYLKTAVYKNPLQHALNRHDSLIIAKVLNEISTGELKYLLECHGTENIFDSSESESFYSDRERTTGLMNLGLLSRSAAGGNGSDVAAYHFTHLADRLVKLFAMQNN